MDRTPAQITIVCAAPVTVEWYAGLKTQALKPENPGEAA
jgi:hypothetical protein